MGRADQPRHPLAAQPRTLRQADSKPARARFWVFWKASEVDSGGTGERTRLQPWTSVSLGRCGRGPWKLPDLRGASGRPPAATRGLDESELAARADLGS